MAERVLEHRPGRVHLKRASLSFSWPFPHGHGQVPDQRHTVDLENKAWAIIRYGQRSGVWPMTLGPKQVSDRIRYVMEN
ncbi:hypothetical protein DPEC_G00368190 [Dallia pectoralis]|nr:hypothetical protein DPEC_G00368190 [Dallia pectoralis]